MICDSGSMSRAAQTGDHFTEKLSNQGSELSHQTSEALRLSKILQTSKGSWEGENAPLSEENYLRSNHVIKMSFTSASLKPGLRSLEQLRATVQRKLFTLERILVTKEHSHTATKCNTSFDSCSHVHSISPSASTVDREVERILWLLENQRRLESSRREVQDSPNAPGCNSTPSATTPPTTGAIYRKLYHRFVARRILRRSPTIHNRRTFIKLVAENIIEAENTDEEWGGETCVEKVQRSLKAMGIEMANMQVTWREQQFIENDPLGRYGCFRPSFLRWSWTAAGEGCPDEES